MPPAEAPKVPALDPIQLVLGSSGVVLVKSTGAAECLLGKTWGYDNTGIWVADGCAGEFLAGAAAASAAIPADAPPRAPTEPSRRSATRNSRRADHSRALPR